MRIRREEVQMTTDKEQDARRADDVPSHSCMPLTPEVLTHLQVCLSSVELLAGISLPAESFHTLGRLALAVEGLVAAAEAARRCANANDGGGRHPTLG
jgi:hypothetical protein